MLSADVFQLFSDLCFERANLLSKFEDPFAPRLFLGGFKGGSVVILGVEPLARTLAKGAFALPGKVEKALRRPGVALCASLQEGWLSLVPGMPEESLKALFAGPAPARGSRLEVITALICSNEVQTMVAHPIRRSGRARSLEKGYLNLESVTVGGQMARPTRSPS